MEKGIFIIICKEFDNRHIMGGLDPYYSGFHIRSSLRGSIPRTTSCFLVRQIKQKEAPMTEAAQ